MLSLRRSIESLKNPFAVSRRNHQASVAYRKHDCGVLDREYHLDLRSGFGVFDGVVNQLRDRGLNQFLVRQYGNFIAGDRQVKSLPIFLGG